MLEVLSIFSIFNFWCKQRIKSEFEKNTNQVLCLLHQTKTYVSSINKDLIVDDIFIVINFYYNILTVGKTIILQIVKSSKYEKEYSCLE